jgi:histidine phosphotransferase ChpT
MSNHKNTIAIDTSILELVCSKLCHDLISPIGAINNGVEFLEDMGADAGNEVTSLIAHSAQQASAKLQAYRMAYGAGGADDTIKPEDVQKSIQGMIGGDNKIKQDWDAWGPLGYGDDRPHGYCKILICALLLGMECLPKGGTLSVKAGAKPGESLITATGPDANVRGQTAKALSGDLHRDALEPKYVHPYVSGLLAKTYGFGISMSDNGTGSVTITLDCPSA